MYVWQIYLQRARKYVGEGVNIRCIFPVVMEMYGWGKPCKLYISSMSGNVQLRKSM